MAAHAWFAVVLALTYAAVINASNPDVQLGWSSAATHRNPWHWNERLWFLVFGNTLFFGVLAIRDILTANVGPKWPKIRVSPT